MDGGSFLGSVDSPFHSFVTTCFVCVRGSSSCRSLCTRRLGNGGVHQLAGQLGIPHPRMLVCGLIRSNNLVIFIYIEDMDLRLGLSLDRPGKLIPNLTACPAPKTSRKYGSV